MYRSMSVGVCGMGCTPLDELVLPAEDQGAGTRRRCWWMGKDGGLGGVSGGRHGCMAEWRHTGARGYRVTGGRRARWPHTRARGGRARPREPASAGVSTDSQRTGTCELPPPCGTQKAVRTPPHDPARPLRSVLPPASGSHILQRLYSCMDRKTKDCTLRNVWQRLLARFLHFC